MGTVVIDIYKEVDQFVNFESASTYRPRVRDLHKITLDRNSNDTEAKQFFYDALMTPASRDFALHGSKPPMYIAFKRSNLGLLSSILIDKAHHYYGVSEKESVLPYVFMGEIMALNKKEKTSLIDVIVKNIPENILNMFKH